MHLALHFLLPLAIACLAYPEKKVRALLLLLSGLVIDIDHLLATPIYDPLRCSLGFHPLHTALPIAVYLALLCFRPTRIFAIGLCVHIGLDAIDCRITSGIWYSVH